MLKKELICAFLRAYFALHDLEKILYTLVKVTFVTCIMGLDFVCYSRYRKNDSIIMSKIDDIDQKIINLLMDDGRIPCTEIARNIGNISERAVRYRIDRLTKEGVIKVCGIVNPKSVGYVVIADIMLEVESDSILSVAKKMIEYESVSYVACGIGETDVSVQVVGHNNEEIYHFITEVIGKVPGVRKTTTSIVPLVLKDVYQWRIPNSNNK